MTDLLLPGRLEISHDFDRYDQALAEVNDIFPQRQGLIAEEYPGVVSDPRVLSTPVMSQDGSTFLVPQLAPVEAYSWLNSDFYGRRFPEDTAAGRIMHFQDVPGVVPGLQVVEGLRSLAEMGGTLVYDHPSVTPGYSEQLQGFLDSVGVVVRGDQELGTQTYFAGKISLKAGFDPDKEILSLSRAFQALQSERPQVGEETTGYLETLDPENLDRMQACYADAFVKLNDHPCRQGLTPDELREVAFDQPQTAKLVHSVGSKITAMCILGDDLTLYPWLNPAFYAARYPSETANDQILYFPAIATDPKSMGEHNAEKIVAFIAQMLERGNNEAVIAFDCCDMNTGFLDAYLDTIINATPETGIKFETIGVQRYGAMAISLVD